MLTFEQIAADLAVIERALPAIERSLNHIIRAQQRGHHKETLTVANIATDDQKFTQLFSPADADQIPVPAGSAAVTVTVQDAAGNDVSKWVDVQQDPTNPLQYTYRRKPNADGTQPAQLDFSAVGTSTVNGTPVTFKTDLSFVPGAPATLTATTTVEPIAAPPA